MKLIETAMTAVVTLGAVTPVAVAVDVPDMVGRSQSTADKATCRTVNAAILAFYAEQQVQPTTMKQISPYVAGDVTGYRIVAGAAAGPGCASLSGR